MVNATRTKTLGTSDPVCRERTYVMGDFTNCGKPAKHDDDTRCGIHSAAAKAARVAKRDAKYQGVLLRAQERDRQQKIRRVAKITDVIMAKTPVPMTLAQAAALALAIDGEVRK